jgi:hypothetical protein
MVKKPIIFKKKILIIGFGRIGTSFYKLFLIKKYELFVIDKKEKIKLIKKSIKKNLNFCGDIKAINNLKKINFDLIILSVNTKNKVKILKKINKLTYKKYLIEKTVCNNLSDLSFYRKKKHFYAHHQRRFLKVYKFLKCKHKKDIFIEIYIEKNIIGNISHFLDLAQFLFNAKLVKIEFMNNKIPTKNILTLNEARLIFNNNIIININQKKIKKNSLELFLYENEKLKYKIFENISSEKIYLFNSKKIIFKEDFNKINNAKINYLKINKNNFSIINKNYIANNFIFLKSVNKKYRKLIE